MDRQPIISAKDVEITFSLRGKKLNAIRKCSLDLYDGETLAIVGESGSGKSVFTKTFVGMLDVNGKITGGSIMYEGRDMTKFTEKDWLGVRGKKIAMVMQDPMTSLNPLKKIGKQIQESIEHHQGLKGAEAKKAAIEMLAKVGIPDPERRYEQYPHEFSGGMRQRVVIAIAAACVIKVVGYYIAEVIINGNPVAPVSSIPGNLVQIGVAAVIVLIVITPLNLAARKTGLKR